jgi:hypothetical protein
LKRQDESTLLASSPCPSATDADHTTEADIIERYHEPRRLYEPEAVPPHDSLNGTIPQVLYKTDTLHILHKENANSKEGAMEGTDVLQVVKTSLEDDGTPVVPQILPPMRERCSDGRDASTITGDVAREAQYVKGVEAKIMRRILARSLHDVTGFQAQRYGGLFDTGATGIDTVAENVAGTMHKECGVPIERYQVPKEITVAGNKQVISEEFIRVRWMLRGEEVDPQSWPETVFSIIKGDSPTLGYDFILSRQSIAKLHMRDIRLGI